MQQVLSTDKKNKVDNTVIIDYNSVVAIEIVVKIILNIILKITSQRIDIKYIILKEKDKKEMEETVRKSFINVREMTVIALFAALITVCSFIRVPIGAVPFTMQTFAVFATAGILGLKKGSIAMIVYELLGMVGLPVFGGKGGFSVITGPTGGYITGFIFSVIVASLIIMLVKSDDIKIKAVVMFIAFLLGDVVCFVLGTIQFMYVSGNSLAVSMGYCVTPFIVPDIVKIIIAVIISLRVKKYFDNIMNS